MDVDYDVEDSQSRSHRRYDFSSVRPGASVHVKTEAERCRVMAAFKYWARTSRKLGAYATSAKVGAEDPKGAGFRIWFKSKKVDVARTDKLIDRPQEDI